MKRSGGRGSEGRKVTSGYDLFVFQIYPLIFQLFFFFLVFSRMMMLTKVRAMSITAYVVGNLFG